MICVPPFSADDGGCFEAHLPWALRSHPTAIIDYRWPGSSILKHASPVPDGHLGQEAISPVTWPMPLHDVSFAYSWMMQNLAPSGQGFRDVYVYGSYLGASLAAGLALTESHKNLRMTVRGLVAFNGIYDWTTFLPDHPVQKERRRRSQALSPDDSEASLFHRLRTHMPVLFQKPENLFDPFASPSLLFHSPPLWVPPTFAAELPISPSLERLLKEMKLTPDEREMVLGRLGPLKPPQRGHIQFPPEESTLQIPHMLLLHETTASSARLRASRKPASTLRTRRSRPTGDNDFAVQAEELADFARRSLGRADASDDEIERRVRVVDVGPVEGDATLSDRAQEEVAAWLRGRLGEPK